MRIDRVPGHKQPVADLTVHEALREELGDPSLAIGKAVPSEGAPRLTSRCDVIARRRRSQAKDGSRDAVGIDDRFEADHHFLPTPEHEFRWWNFAHYNRHFIHDADAFHIGTGATLLVAAAGWDGLSSACSASRSGPCCTRSPMSWTATSARP